MKKQKTVLIVVLLIALSAIARIVVPFQNWNQVEQNSPCIIIAHCEEPTTSTNSDLLVNATISDSFIKVLSILKGTNNLSVSRLLTDHELQQGENYLLFGYCENEIFQACEEYRVVPLGAHFSTNLIAGKSLDEQLHILFQRRFDKLNRQMKEAQLEKQRLEVGLTNGSK